MVYTGSSQTQESPEKQLDGSKTNSPEQTKPEIAKDAIKKSTSPTPIYLPMVWKTVPIKTSGTRLITHQYRGKCRAKLLPAGPP